MQGSCSRSSWKPEPADRRSAWAWGWVCAAPTPPRAAPLVKMVIAVTAGVHRQADRRRNRVMGMAASCLPPPHPTADTKESRREQRQGGRLGDSREWPHGLGSKAEGE